MMVSTTWQQINSEPGIGCWDLDGVLFRPSLREITIGRHSQRLPPKPAAVLEMLVRAAPEPVSKDQLLDAIWPHQVVGDSVVADAVKYLRRVVSRHKAPLIETLHKHGYRLAVDAVENSQGRPSRGLSTMRRVLGWSLPVAGLLVGAFVLASGDPPRVTTPAPTHSLAHHRSEADIYFLRGVQHYRRYRQIDNLTAIELFERVLEIDPGYLRAWSGLANAYAMQAHKFGASREWVDQGEEFARRAIALNAGDPTGHKALGVVLSYDGRMAEAAQAYQRALSIYGDYVAARVNLGGIRVNQGRITDAIALLEGALHIAPEGVLSRLQLGHAYRAIGMDELARVWYETGFTLAPGSPADAAAQMPFLLSRGQFDTAQDMLDRMSPEFDSNPYWLYWSGMTAHYLGELTSARSDFLAAAHHSDPNNALWIDAMLRAQLVDRVSGNEPDRGLLDRLEERVTERLSRGSEGWNDPLRLGLIGHCQGDSSALAAGIDEALARGWLYLDELIADPAFASLSEDEKSRFSNRIITRQRELIARLSHPPSAFVSN